MKFFLSLLTIVTMAPNVFAASKTLLKCSVGDVRRYEGARVNVIQNEKGEIRANLIFGTTVSGTMYKVDQNENSFAGFIKRRPQFKIELVLTEEPAANKYINGYRAKLTAQYPDIRKASGWDGVVTTTNDNFVCGEQIAPFGRSQ